MYMDSQMPSQLAAPVTTTDESQTVGTALAPETVATPEARVLAQGAFQLKAQAQNFQVPHLDC